jgi:GTPase
VAEPDHEATSTKDGQEPTRCGFISIIGATNAGKSTLVNALVGAKVTIVSHKVQTTRTQIRGIAVEGRSQLVFIDTPGIFRPRRRLDRAMVDAAWGSADDVDSVLLLIDALRGITDDVERVIERLKGTGRPVVVILNKVDKIEDKEVLLKLAERLAKEIKIEQLFMVSALSGSGVAAVRSYFAKTVPLGPWHYPEDDISDAPMRVLASEITRERIYHWLHDELPYETTVETTAWVEKKDGSIRIEQTIFVMRDTQKAIVLGKDGQSIKKISMETRKELSSILEKTVHLFLFVKVREGWESDPERYREMGLEFPKE